MGPVIKAAFSLIEYTEGEGFILGLRFVIDGGGEYEINESGF